MSYDEAQTTIDARDVLDVNALVRRGFVGRVRGHFRRVGPNSWDDYEYIDEPAGPTIDVYPGIKIQLEPSGCDFRMRATGRVLRVSWAGSAPDPSGTAGRLAQPSTPLSREAFIEHYIEAFDEKPGYGAAAVIARKLR